MVYGIIVGGGKGSRLGKQIPKAFVELCGFPLFAFSLSAFLRSRVIDAIVLVFPEDYIEHVSKKIPPLWKRLSIVKGGKERYNSVLAALESINEPNSVVAIHDASRPFVSASLIDMAVVACQKENTGVIVGLPVRDTVKIVKDDYIIETADRTKLWLAQTPQVFRFNVIYEAYRSMPSGFLPTDDSQLVERYGGKVKIIPGNFINFKITYPEELELAEAIVKGFPSSELPPDGLRSLRVT